MEIKSQGVFSDIANRTDLLISASGYVVTDETWRQKPIFAPFSRLYYVVEGSGLLLTQTEQVRLEPGYVYLAPCGTEIGFRGTDSVTKLFFHINVLLPNGNDALGNFRRIARLERPVAFTEELLSRYFSDDLTKHLLVKGELFRTVSDFIRLFSDDTAQKIRYSSCVAQAIGYIRKHYSAKLMVSEIADAVFCSREQLYSAFKKEVGVTVAHYTESLVMSDIQQILSYTDMPIKEIAAKFGFCDQYYLSRRFKQLFNHSPSEYRSKKRNTV